MPLGGGRRYKTLYNTEAYHALFISPSRDLHIA